MTSRLPVIHELQPDLRADYGPGDYDFLGRQGSCDIAE
jgi:hypothetical protein